MAKIVTTSHVSMCPSFKPRGKKEKKRVGNISKSI